MSETRKIVTREEAKEVGLKKFFTGIPCKNGHLGERYTKNGICCVCTSEQWKRSHPAESERERHNKRRTANPEKFLEYSRQYNKLNRDKRNAGARRRHKENPQQAKDKAARMKAKDPTRQSHYSRVSYLRHTEKRKAAAQKWRKENPEKTKEQYARWLRENPEKARAKSHRRRARISGVGGSYSKDDIDRIYKMQNGCCAYCRQELKGKFQIDHIVPISKGGPNIARNIQLLCNKNGGGCNQRKRDRDPIEYAQSLGLML